MIQLYIEILPKESDIYSYMKKRNEPFIHEILANSLNTMIIKHKAIILELNLVIKKDNNFDQ